MVHQRGMSVPCMTVPCMTVWCARLGGFSRRAAAARGCVTTQPTHLVQGKSVQMNWAAPPVVLDVKLEEGKIGSMPVMWSDLHLMRSDQHVGQLQLDPFVCVLELDP